MFREKMMSVTLTSFDANNTFHAIPPTFWPANVVVLFWKPGSAAVETVSSHLGTSWSPSRPGDRTFRYGLTFSHSRCCNTCIINCEIPTTAMASSSQFEAYKLRAVIRDPQELKAAYKTRRFALP